MRFKSKSPTSDCIPPRHMLYMIYNKLPLFWYDLAYLLAELLPRSLGNPYAPCPLRYKSKSNPKRALNRINNSKIFLARASMQFWMCLLINRSSLTSDHRNVQRKIAENKKRFLIPSPNRRNWRYLARRSRSRRCLP